MSGQLMRRALWATAGFNIFGAYLFAFPASALGQFAGLPANVPPAYRALLAMFALLFGGAYAWLASQPTFDRPLVAFAAIGKASAFLVVFGLWLSGAAEGRSVGMVAGDLAFAGLFAAWLVRSGEAAGTRAPARL